MMHAMNANPYQPKLVFDGEPFDGRVYQLTLERTTVGRGHHNTLAIRHASVSSSHCEIMVFGPEVIVRDLHSSNGTFVHGIRIDAQAQLKHGQLVRFGDVTARLELVASSWDDTVTEETAVFANRRHARDQRRENEAPIPVSPAMQLGAEAESDQTIVANDVVSIEVPASPVLKPVRVVPARSIRQAEWIIFAVGIAMAVGLVVWWMFF